MWYNVNMLRSVLRMLYVKIRIRSVPYILPAAEVWQKMKKILRRKEDTMKNWKMIAIIAATAVATAVAVSFICDKMNRKRRRLRFDSTEFDERDYADDPDDMDAFDCGEQCSRCKQDLDIELPDDTEDTRFDAGSLEEAAEIEEMLSKSEDADEEAEEPDEDEESAE